MSSKKIMLTRAVIGIALGIALAASPLKDSKFVDFLIAITGG
jgi:hypothetical protein